MSNKHDKEQRRKKKLREREEAKKRRTTTIRDSQKLNVVHQHSTKGYDVEMIRDFLDHLLLELRAQHYEDLKLLKALGSTDYVDSVMKVTQEVSEKIVQQFMVFQKKYQVALIACNVFDNSNTMEEERKEAMKGILKGMMANRDEQIGHLEALQGLFREALYCAKLPFGIDKDDNKIQPQIIHNIREILDKGILAKLPKYEDLLPLFPDHFLATEEGIKRLKEHDRSVPILAKNDAFDKSLILYGTEFVEQQLKEGKAGIKAVSLSVSSYSELQFIIAAIAKFVGVPSTDGSTWKDL